jgi:hypothetical protein
MKPKHWLGVVAIVVVGVVAYDKFGKGALKAG